MVAGNSAIILMNNWVIVGPGDKYLNRVNQK